MLIDEEGHLLGLVTDGDNVRRVLISSNFLEWPCRDMMTAMPRTELLRTKLLLEVT